MKGTFKNALLMGWGVILWSGGCDRHGYGRKTLTWCTTGKQKIELVHRVAYMLHKKRTEVPHTNGAGDLMDDNHRCHEKLCIRLVWEYHYMMLALDVDAARRSILHLAFCYGMIAFICYTVSVIFLVVCFNAQLFKV